LSEPEAQGISAKKDRRGECENESQQDNAFPSGKRANGKNNQNIKEVSSVPTLSAAITLSH